MDSNGDNICTTKAIWLVNKWRHAIDKETCEFKEGKITYRVEEKFQFNNPVITKMIRSPSSLIQAGDWQCHGTSIGGVLPTKIST